MKTTTFFFFGLITAISGINPIIYAQQAHRNAAQSVSLPSPIMFVTQIPMPFDSSTSTAVFCNHKPDVFSVVRGGDLYIIYPDGTLKNLTQLAGYGTASGLQGASSIAVRQPSIHWSGTKALFSMVVGAPASSGAAQPFYWQIYEVTNIGQQQTPVITKIANQPVNYNNVSPIYGTDGRIIFTSDRPRNGLTHLYPLLDEYRGAVSTSGLWSLEAASGDLKQLNDLPSGCFSPMIDSYGRVIFTRWDHLQRDGNADADALGKANNGTFNYSDESPNATITNSRAEIFPEPQGQRTDLLAGTNMVGMEFNQFFPWQINEDGTSEETLNHVGRHDLRFGIGASINDDANVVNLNYATSGRLNNATFLQNFLQIAEDPAHLGDYYGVDCFEFGTHGAGQILKLKGQTTLDPGAMQLSYITDKTTSSSTQEGKQPAAANSGKYRNPLPLSNGTLLAVHSTSTFDDKNTGTRTHPQSRYDFRIKSLKTSGSVWIPDQLLTTGISKTLTYYDPDSLCSYSGTLWELDPVEVRSRTAPQKRVSTLATLERQVFSEEGVDETVFRNDMAQKGIALIVSRNVTHRDKSDHQQPFYLKVHNSTTQSASPSGKIYDIAHFQMYQADHLRGLHFGNINPVPGRRILPEFMHDSAVYFNQPTSGEQLYSVKIASDGSYAAYVPTRRAITWALVDSNFNAVVRERYWITTQPGEIRVCASCHGTNDDALSIADPAPQNKPEALRSVLQYWKSSHTPIAPTLISPSKDSVDVPAASPLVWNLQANAVSYHLQISTMQNFYTTVYDDSTLSSETYSYSGFQPKTKYYWRISAKGLAGTSPWSEVWNFTTIPNAPIATILLSPANNSKDQPLNQTLTWKQTTDAASYHVQLSTVQNFATTFIDSGGVKSTTLPVTALQNSVTYYWRVQASNSAGSGPWSDVWNFTTTTTVKPIAEAPILISPANHSDIADTVKNIIYVWHTSKNTNNYEISVADDSLFNKVKYVSGLLSDTTITRSEYGTKLYWRIRPYGDAGFGPSSEIWNFTLNHGSSVGAHKQNTGIELSAFPNPLSSKTTLRVLLVDRGMVSLKLFDLLGREMATVASGMMEAGSYSINYDGSSLPAGSYFLRLEENGKIALLIITVLK